jgi:anthranilate synthase/aminodeoxychorismate synthase-like glutamine amidotransferase
MSADPRTTAVAARPGEGLRVFVLDNYDSFTYNLVQFLSELGAEIQVARNDAVTPEKVESDGFDGVVISPGPGIPSRAGASEPLIERLSGRVPLLGVCLGHQALGEVFGARVVRAGRLMHGKTSPILHDGRGLFEDLENPFIATRYHSLLLDPDSVAEPLELCAWTAEGEVMGIRHRTHPSWGVQFHPESILTEAGKHLLGNFLSLCRRRRDEGASEGRTPDGGEGP